jgi:uncharacterized protein
MYNSRRIEYDPLKNRINWEKHGVVFSDVENVFTDPLALTTEDREHAEQRWITLGMDGLGRIVVVVYTWRGNVIRIVSARRASCSERRRYEERL